MYTFLVVDVSNTGGGVCTDATSQENKMLTVLAMLLVVVLATFATLKVEFELADRTAAIEENCKALAESYRDLSKEIKVLIPIVLGKERKTRDYLEIAHTVVGDYPKRQLVTTIRNKTNSTRGAVIIVLFADAEGELVSYHQDLITITEVETVRVDVPPPAKQYLIVLADTRDVLVPFFVKGVIPE